MAAIDTAQSSAHYRDRLIDVANRRILISRIAGSEQEPDLTEPTNAGGLGRVRHFRRASSERWIPNPLPIDPACARLGLKNVDCLNSQVFQNAACNWRCWYCFVPFDLLAAAPRSSVWTSALDLVRAYAELPDRPPVLDLSGGQPELTPEWVLWMMDALDEAGLSSSVYLWSDDNLSVDYFWRYLSPHDRLRIRRYSNYGRVACFKGFDSKSFEFNTAASPSAFDPQFEIFKRYIAEGIDIYAYVTLTHAHVGSVADAVRSFIDRLQEIDEKLPLRTVPLEIRVFAPVWRRLDDLRNRAIEVAQYEALDVWRRELEERFSPSERGMRISEVRWASV